MVSKLVNCLVVVCSVVCVCFCRSVLTKRWLHLETSRPSNLRIQKVIPPSVEFPCRFIASSEDSKAKDRKKNRNDIEESHLPRARSEVRPASVHKLRPGDFDIIAAIGDSLTAGNGAAASNIFHVRTENRGISWSIGGKQTWREYLTLPNILKVFNPNLIGYSLDDSLGSQKNSQFNVGELAAMSEDLVHMAKILVQRIKTDPRVDFENDWKLVTLLMGANDFCLNVCYQKSAKRTLEKHRVELLEALTYLKDNLPRTFVNLVPAPDVRLLETLRKKPPLCVVANKFECPCILGLPNKSKYNETSEIIKKWQQIDMDMQYTPELNDKEDFAVVIQPFHMKARYPLINGVTDYSFLSTDCFHFSQKGYTWVANAIWNNMLQMPGKKQMKWNDPFKQFVCPTVEYPYVFTLKNGKKYNENTINAYIDKNK